MSIAVPEFSRLEQTAFLTAYARALDCRSPVPILGDEFSDRVVGQIDYDFPAFRIPASVVRQTALRAKMLDERVRAYTSAHPDAVVVDLGAGLNEPLARVKPPAGVDWYSIDLPHVIALREKVVPAQPGEHVIAADLTGTDWTEGIPVGRPTMVIADGLFAFLTEPQVIALIAHAIDHFGTGELAFNDYGRVGPFSWLGMKLAPRGCSPCYATSGPTLASPTLARHSGGIRGCAWSKRPAWHTPPRWIRFRARLAPSPALPADSSQWPARPGCCATSSEATGYRVPQASPRYCDGSKSRLANGSFGTR